MPDSEPPGEEDSMELEIGDLVAATGPRMQGRRGRIVSVDADHYHSAINGWAVYVVRWNDGAVGSGWTADDLRKVGPARPGRRAGSPPELRA